MGKALPCNNQRSFRGLGAVVELGLLLGLVAYPTGTVMAAAPTTPNFGPNVLIFTPSMPAAAIEEQIDKVYAIQKDSQFGAARYALLFAPGEYKLDVPIGYYTQALGLGASPDKVHIEGNVHSDATLANNNATCTFWKTAEGFSVTPAGGTMQWAVSQAIALRRMHVRGDLVLHQKGGWASGGWLSDSLIDGTVGSGSQQQWVSRNAEWGKWTGSNWNMLFLGVVNPPPGDWPTPPYTKIAQTPVIREKPFLQVDAAGNYSVLLPELRSNATGITWRAGSTPGKAIPIGKFYIARPNTDTAASMNAHLSKGEHLLLTPGIYRLTEPIRVAKANTIVYGLGLAGVGWTSNTSANGLVVNGDNVTAYGLFVEHHQEYQVLWNGNGGRVYFYQSEIPYDPPDQASYTSAPGTNGWASYKVADKVTSHEAWGLGVYSVFRNRGVVLTRALEVPKTPDVKFHSMITVRLGNNGEISNVIDNTGGAAQGNARPKVTQFP